ncbi:UDP-glycosyltransferase UGT5-like [Lutzomyia longipalpis]|uniref:UDP-glycosyltransferase UGT5-like n=1 Tax=Lutzomyia longipalpis TaxID=7200 RepID=UPI002483FF55|nr:UDP-glycosyltransferase UGT5-like [Lutzomyia longipalpis]
MEMKMKLSFLMILPYFSIAGNILVLIPIPSRSHIVWINSLTDVLAERGQNITFLSCDIYGKKMPNIHHLELDVAKRVYDEEFGKIDAFKLGQEFPISQFINITKNVHMACTQSTGYQQLLEYPDDFKFDLIIYEYSEKTFLLQFAEKFGNPPIIGATCVATPFTITFLPGNLISPSFVEFRIERNSMRLTTFWGRFVNYLIVFSLEILSQYNAVSFARGELFPNKTHPFEFEKKVKLILINKHPASDEIAPLWPHVIPVGGLHIQPPKDLPKDLLKDILDSAKDGVILFSLGSVVQSSKMAQDHLTEIVEAFRALPQYTFLWKYEKSSLHVEIPSNVIIRKWLPQNDILAHPNLKLFITHAGILSTHETIWHGVPALGLPVFLDQFSNIEHCVKSGFAEEEDITKIERNSFRKLIVKMMNDPKYKENAMIYSQLFRDQIDNPLDRAVWWTEFVMRHPNMTFMSPPYADVSPFIRHSWDVLAFLYLLFLITLYITFKIISFFVRKCIHKYLCSHNRKPKKE